MLRFSALMNGIFIGVGIIFLIWGATDIAFPITERMSAAVFGLMRITLGVFSLSVGIGIESVQWAKIVEKPRADKETDTTVLEPIIVEPATIAEPKSTEQTTTETPSTDQTKSVQ